MSNSASPRRTNRRIDLDRSLVVLLISSMGIGGVLPLSSSVANKRSHGALAATVSVQDPGGRAVELIRRVTIPQLAALLGTTTAQLAAQIGALPGLGSQGALIQELLTNPNATLESLLNALAAQGVNTDPVKHLVNSLIGTTTEGSGQVLGSVTTLLHDLALDGQLVGVSGELAIPAGELENAPFVASTAGQLASTLNTTVDRLSTLLMGAGAITGPLMPTTPLATAQVKSGGSGGGTTVLVGAPNGSGGVTLTTIHSTEPPGSLASTPGGSRAIINNAFWILSVKVTRDGMILEKIRTSGPGRVALSATARKRVAIKAKHGRRVTMKTLTIASAKTPVQGGVRTLTLRPIASARSARRLRVLLTTTYTPTGGSANTKRTSVTITHGSTPTRKHR
jgi:hypothetical protein